jgi:aspartate-semialdehyde dehydrogenase
MLQKLPVAILGATGAVGQRFIQLLQHHPWFEVTELAASERSAGKTYAEAVNWVLEGDIPEAVRLIEVQALSDTLQSPLVFSALPGEIARDLEPQLASQGHVVCSNASAHRMADDVPLLIPEINADHLGLIDLQRQRRGWETGALVTNSNCTSMPLTMALAPLRAFQPTHVHVVSMQAISGAGYPGVASFDILDNVIPFIKNEEEKLQEEPAKILGKFTETALMPFEMTVSAACNRVPVIDAHLISVAVQFATSPSLDDIRAAWEVFQPHDDIRGLPSAPDHMVLYTHAVDRPQPRRDRNAGHGMTATIGRLRRWEIIENGVQFLALSHNTIRGAAGCSILNAELLATRGYITTVEPQELTYDR